MSVTTQNKLPGGFFMLMKVSTQPRFQPVEIGNLDGVRAIVQPVDEVMSAHAGIGMIGQIERKFGLVAELAERINDPRLTHLVDHTTSDILLQRVSQVAAGFTDGNDCDWLRFDSALKWSLNRHPVFGAPGASQETTCRFELKAITKGNRRKALNTLIDHYIKHHKKPPKEIVIEPDGSMIKTYGAQQGSVYRGGKYKHEMYFPLFIFIGEWIVSAVLRAGNKSEARTILSELKVLVRKLRDKWRSISIKVRMDAAFPSPGLLSWLRQQRIGYEMGLRPTSVLTSYSQFGKARFLGRDGNRKAQAEHQRIRELPKDRRMVAEHELAQRRTRVFGEFYYKPNTWQEWERVIARCDYTDKGPDLRLIVVSQQRGIPRSIYEDSYCRRGALEQLIGQLKRTGQKLSAQTFRANQFRLLLYATAYQLLVHLRESAKGTMEKSDVSSLRQMLMMIPMVVRFTRTKVMFQISQLDPRCRHFLAAWRRLSTA
jgi:hypothetical protein